MLQHDETKITLSEYARIHGYHRPQLMRWKKAGRIIPAPVPGISRSGRLAYVLPPDAVIVDLTRHRAAQRSEKSA